MTHRSNVSGRTSGGLRLTQNTERRKSDAVLDPFGAIGPLPGREFPTRVVPGLARRPPPDPDEQQGLIDYSGDLNHTNDGSVIERRWARNMDAVCGQLQAVTAQLAVMASGRKAPPAAAGAGDGDHGGSSDNPSDSGDSERPRRRRDFSSDSDEDQIVRQGRGNRGRRPVVPSLPSSSTSSGDEDKGIVDRIDAIRKGRRLSAFGVLPDVEKKKAKRWGRDRQEEGLSVRNLPTRSDHWLNFFGVPELLQFEAKYTLLQQDWSQPLRIAKYMDEPIVNRIENEASRLPAFEEILRGRNLLCAGTQLLTNDQIWTVIKKVVEPLNAEEVRRYLSQSVYPASHYAKFKDSRAIEENFAEYRNSWTNYDKMFLKMLNLIMGKRSRKHFPQSLFGGSGKADAKEKGWIQYYFEGSPNPTIAHLIFKREVSEQERKSCREFDDFRKLFFRALDKTEVSLRKESARRSLFRNQEPAKISEPPPERKFSGKPKSKFRGGRVHQIDEDQGQDPSDGD